MSTSRRLTFSPMTIVAIGAAAAALIFTPLRGLHAQMQVAQKSSPAKKSQTKKPILIKRGLDYAASAIALRHWQTARVQIYVIPAADDTRSPEEVHTLVAHGLALWKDKIKAMDGDLPVLITNNIDDANIKISFVPAGSLSGGRIGVTDVLFTVPQQIIESAKIRLVEGLTDDQMVQAVAHETGHALGIQGHSDAKSDLMYPYAHLPAEVTPRDANTIDLAYAKVQLKATRDLDSPNQKYAVVTSDAPQGKLLLKPRSILRKSDF